MGSPETALALTLSARQASDFELLANGGFAPLDGFMGADDWRSVCEEMRLESGDIWPIPITLATDLEASAGDVVELSAPNGKRLGRLEVSEVFDRDVDKEAELVYRTTDDEHPGVAAIRARGLALRRRTDRGGRASGPRGRLHAPLSHPRGVEEGVRRTEAGSGSSPSRPATRSTAPTST